MDWKTVIADIQRHGQMTQPQIAEKVGCGQATISDLVNGATKQPRYPLGVALIGLLKTIKPDLGEREAA
jgi:predicted XRE-type DNA-binding protein